MKRQGPPYRWDTRTWLARLRADPALSLTAVSVATLLVREPDKRRGNRYARSAASLAVDLNRTPRAVTRALVLLESTGWLVRCGHAHRGRAQRWHRSAPWDPVHVWGLQRCQDCGHRGTPNPVREALAAGRKDCHQRQSERQSERQSFVRDRADSLGSSGAHDPADFTGKNRDPGLRPTLALVRGGEGLTDGDGAAAPRDLLALFLSHRSVAGVA